MMSISKLANFGTMTRFFVKKKKKSVESFVCLSEINYQKAISATSAISFNSLWNKRGLISCIIKIVSDP